MNSGRNEHLYMLVDDQVSSLSTHDLLFHYGREVLPKLASRALVDGERPVRKRFAAGVLSSDGQFIFGVNRKYSHPTLACCAEDGACGAWSTLGGAPLIGVAVYSPDLGPDEYPEPCGRCKEILFECAAPQLDQLPVACVTTQGGKLVHITGGFSSRIFSGDAAGVVGAPIKGFTNSKLTHGPGVTDRELEDLRASLRHLIPNSNYSRVVGSGVEPESAVVIAEDGGIYFGVSFRSGNPPFSLTALRVALGNAVALGQVPIVAAMLHVPCWNSSRDSRLVFDPADIARLRLTHVHPTHRKVELFLSVGGEALKNYTLNSDQIL